MPAPPRIVRRMLPSLLVLLTAAPAGAASTTLTILHVNDTHSRLEASGPRDASLRGTLGGLEKAAAVIAAEKRTDPSALFVHAGDVFDGDLYFDVSLGVQELLLLQDLGLDAMAVGNHEFHSGPDFLAGVLAEAWPVAGGVPLLGSNLDLSSYPLLTTWIEAPFVKDVAGVKVGFLGMTTPYDLLERPAPVVIREDFAAAAAEGVSALHAQGAQVVVCLAHLGLPLSRALAAQVVGIDVIVNGHDHVALARPESVARAGGGTTLIVSAGEFYRWVGRLRLSFDGARVRLLDYALLDVDAATPAFPLVSRAVFPLRQEIAARFGDVYAPLATATATLSRESDHRFATRDSAIGNLVTDAYRAAGNTQIALEATGLLDDDLQAGTVVAADVFHVMPYGTPELSTGGLAVRPFGLATFRMTGANLVRGLETGLAIPDVFLQVSGLRFGYDSRAPEARRVLLDTVYVDGHALELDGAYTVTVNEGVLAFLPQMGIEVTDVRPLSVTAWEAVGRRIAALGVLEPVVSGRIRDVAATGD